MTAIVKKFNILLLGDNGVDQYQYGTVDRISPEAPVPIVTYSHTVTKPGMAANVRENLLELNCDIAFVHGLKTCVKTRVIDIRSNQQLLRIDQDLDSKPIKLELIALSDYDAIVISDYDKGSITYEIIQQVRNNYVGPVFVDTKKTDLARLEGCIVKINLLEYNKLTSKPSANTDLIVTHGDKGVEWNGTKFTAKKVEVSDVCGAGDTFLAALAYGYLEYKTMKTAIEFAIKASAVTVQHVGVHAPTLGEINAT